MSKQSKQQPLGQTIVPQAERYTGWDVPGMEYTTAKPMGYETGADAPVPMPGKPWPETFCHYAVIKGKKVATFCEE